mmetsp:Transcript_1258/g.3538  ORF Transcript_1258/g.3538 Transcript_1258/m.3538 type:complete len:332 (+) Transcript_1258:393-1388(+)
MRHCNSRSADNTSAGLLSKLDYHRHVDPGGHSLGDWIVDGRHRSERVRQHLLEADRVDIWLRELRAAQDALNKILCLCRQERRLVEQVEGTLLQPKRARHVQCGAVREPLIVLEHLQRLAREVVEGLERSLELFVELCPVVHNGVVRGAQPHDEPDGQPLDRLEGVEEARGVVGEAVRADAHDRLLATCPQHLLEWADHAIDALQRLSEGRSPRRRAGSRSLEGPYIARWCVQLLHNATRRRELITNGEELPGGAGVQEVEVCGGLQRHGDVSELTDRLRELGPPRTRDRLEHTPGGGAETLSIHGLHGAAVVNDHETDGKRLDRVCAHLR